MYSNTANMLKQTNNLINALKKLKQNLSFVKLYINSDRILAIYFLVMHIVILIYLKPFIYL